MHMLLVYLSHSTPLSLASLRALPLGPASRITSFTPILSRRMSIASVKVSVLPHDDLETGRGLGLFLYDIAFSLDKLKGGREDFVVGKDAKAASALERTSDIFNR